MRFLLNPFKLGISAAAALLALATATAALGQTDITWAKANHWAYQPIADPTSPAVKNTDFVRDPIDTFVLAGLEAAGLSPSAQADRRTLLRRLYFDLIGLPPTFEQVQSFINDDSPDAYSARVDALLNDPRFGERWGRHWLDVARYADTIGYDGGGRQRRFPFAWTYRDYVIRAFNEDKPYNRFVLEQIAADKLDLDANDPNLAALGMLTIGRQFSGNIHEITDDRIDVITRGMMGLTVQCARCHDHKYDAIPATDYYALYGVFRNLDVPEALDLPTIGDSMGTPEQVQQYEAELAKRQKAIEDHLNSVQSAVNNEIPKRVDEYLALVMGKTEHINDMRPALRDCFRDAWNDAGKPDEINDEQKQQIIARTHELAQGNPERFKNQTERDQLNQKRGGLITLQLESPGAPPRAMSVTEGRPFDPYVFVRGSAGNRGEKVDRRFLLVLGGQKFDEGSGRLELAQAVIADDNPLTARVWANRVWMHLMDEALVRTPGDFGSRGEAPTHPQLLDHLSTRLIQNDWSTKNLIRAIVMSTTYQQQSSLRETAAAKDPENRLIWRMNRKRLAFEPTHDALLAVANRLDTSMYGRPVDLFNAPYSQRRAVYAFVDRQDLPQTLRAFDFASPDHSTPTRLETTVPQQALFMLNGPFVAEQAKSLTGEVMKSESGDERIRMIYRRVLSRDPDEDELTMAYGFVGDSNDHDTWARLAQTLMMSNEFVFVD